MAVAALLLFVLLPFSQVEATSATCITVHRIRSCDYFMVETPTDYAILEWYGGHDPDKDDMLVGNLGGYGMKTFQDENDDESVRVYVEDYGLSKVSALEKLIDHCG